MSTQHLITRVVRLSAIALWLAATCAADSDQYVTILRSVAVNGHALSPHSWQQDITLRPSDYVQWEVAVRTSRGDTVTASSYLVELRREGFSQQRIQTEPLIEYKGLPEGSYTLHVQAQVAPGITAAPVTIAFRVGNVLSVPQSDPTPATAATSGGFHVQLWIVLALATSVLSLILALLLLQHRRRTRITTRDYEQLQSELAAARERAAELEQQVARLQRTLDEAEQEQAARLQQAQRHAEQLEEQNRHLRQQVERLRQAKQRLEKLQEEKDMVLSMVVHDIKNPLMVIEQLVQLLRSYDSNSTEMQQLLSSLAETTSRILTLSQQLSRLLALERSDGLPLELQTVDLTEILRSVVQRNAYLAQRKNITILLELPDGLTAECDPQRIEEVFDNVVSNAIKYSHPDSVVIVRGRSGTEHHTIEIEDHGVGMTHEDLQRIFERGAPRSNRPTAGEPSSGIGMWIVRRLVERHHGSISVRSTRGEGTVVSISLPVKQPSNAAA